MRLYDERLAAEDDMHEDFYVAETDEVASDSQTSKVWRGSREYNALRSQINDKYRYLIADEKYKCYLAERKACDDAEIAKFMLELVDRRGLTCGCDASLEIYDDYDDTEAQYIEYHLERVVFWDELAIPRARYYDNYDYYGLDGLLDDLDDSDRVDSPPERYPLNRYTVLKCRCIHKNLTEGERTELERLKRERERRIYMHNVTLKRKHETTIKDLEIERINVLYDLACAPQKHVMKLEFCGDQPCVTIA